MTNNNHLATIECRSPLKILWWSNSPWVPSGYGSQTDLVTRELRSRGHEVSIVSNFGNSGITVPLEDGRVVYPCSAGGHDKWGERGVEFVANYMNPDVIVTLYNLWPLNKPLWKKLSEKTPVVCWAPLEHETLMDRNLEFFAETNCVPLPMSRFGETQLTDAGLAPLPFIYHALDPEFLKNGNGKAVRENLKIGSDEFLIGMVAANRDTHHSRKGFPQAFEAVRIFSEYSHDTHLYLHCEPLGGMNLVRMAAKIGLDPDKIHTLDSYSNYFGVPASRMRDTYNSFDVLLSPSLGEGFGIPVIEAQAQNVPVIVNNATAQPELVKAGYVLTDGERYWDEQAGAFYRSPYPPEISSKLELVKQGNLNLDVARKFVRKHFLLSDIANRWEHVLCSIVEK